jgi:Esterase-like activity of phytase
MRHKWKPPLVLAAGLAAVALAVTPAAGHDDDDDRDRHKLESFDHVGTFYVPDNLLPSDPPNTVTAAEIADVTPDGRTLIYTEAPTGRIGFVDIRDEEAPEPDGILDVGGDPTSVAIFGRWALVAVNTGTFAAPAGELVVVDTSSHAIVRRIALAGQPDSVAISPDQKFAAIVVENERNEDVNDGLIPQLPGGTLQVLELKRLFASDPGLRSVDLTGLSETAPTDPEPEYVDINRKNEAVVSLQENNWVAIVDLKRAEVIRDFSAGTATVHKIDATEEDFDPQGNGDLNYVETITRRREPDAVVWIDDDTFASANEGDYVDEEGEEGGSRSFTLWSSRGRVEYESGEDFEHEIARAGHYPESRSENKGNEPEGLEVAKFGGRTLLFVGSERANAVGVYEIGRRDRPEFLQLLPAGIGPEGLKAIPKRDLLAVTAETDGAAEGFAVRPIVTLYELERGEPDYPGLESIDRFGAPVPWVAISGLSGDPWDRDTVWAVSDSILGQAYLYEIDVSDHPARILKRIPVGEPETDDQTQGEYDLEGVFARPEGGFWVASEGRVDEGETRPNQLVRLDEDGQPLFAVPLPPELVVHATSSGFEGVTATGSARRGDEAVWAVIQREWRPDDDPGFVKLARYDVADEEWTFASYPLDPREAPAGFVGLSEITLLPYGNKVAIVERDDRIDREARIKRIYGVDLDDVETVPYGQDLPVVEKFLLRDVLDELDEESISISDKLEGVAVTRDRNVFLATDNDGVDENYGETLFFRIRGF